MWLTLWSSGLTWRYDGNYVSSEVMFKTRLRIVKKNPLEMEQQSEFMVRKQSI